MNQQGIITVTNILVDNLGVFIDPYHIYIHTHTHYILKKNGIVLDMHVCFTNTLQQASL